MVQATPELREIVTDTVRRRLGLANSTLTPDTDLRQFRAFTSFAGVDILDQLEERMGVEVPASLLSAERLRSVAALTDLFSFSLAQRATDGEPPAATALPLGLAGWFYSGQLAHGGRAALVADGESLTYTELAAAVTELAALLEDRMAPGAPLGVVGDRSMQSYVNYLAVARTGRAVVPIHPDFPTARTETMLLAAGAAGVVGTRSSAQVGGTERPGDDLGGAIVHDRSGATRPLTGIAYVLFTSGTTGRPKGIPVTDAQVGSYLGHAVRERGVRPGERASQYFDITFDPSVFDMFTTWAAGGTLVVPDVEQRADPVSFVNDFGIDHWASVPSVVSLSRRMRRLVPDAMPTLRTTWFAGEALTREQALAWARAAPRARIRNAYGPTETTVTCLAHDLPTDPGSWPETSNGTIPIGTPHPGVRVRVVEDELWVSGAQTLSGYLDPADDEGRLVDGWYRTGDVVGRAGDGLVHLGRVDEQVQLGGYRVELSEVEGALRSHADVDDAVAVVIDGNLIAACTGRAEDSEDVLDSVANTLPAYMVPAEIVRVPALPLNDNGKIDRKRVARSLAGAETVAD